GDVQLHVHQGRNLSLLLRPAPLHARGDPRDDQRRMTAMQLTRRLRLGTAIFAACLALTGSARAQGSMDHQQTIASTSSSDLRIGLNSLLKEHVYLAAAATGAALGGRQDEFKSAAGALDANSVALSQAIGSVYGSDAETAFLALWRKHIGFFVDYTTGVAKKD